MKIQSIPTDQILLPSYILDTLKTLPWMETHDQDLNFYPDDMIVVLYGVRGSTAFSGPSTIRYGANTTAYQIWSPKLPQNVLYLGDGGSGILEIDDVVIRKLLAQRINPFSASQSEVAEGLATVINTYSHYHYDHLHLGAPLAGIFHANSISKVIIGGDNPRSQFAKTFKRPTFPRDFGEIQGAYSFHDVSDPRSSILIFTPNGEFRQTSTSEFQSYLQNPNPQIKHNKVFYNLEDCLVVRMCNADHPDPCISFRYENYNSKGQLMSSFTFMTDHEIRETDDRNSYFKAHVQGSDVLYIDGQYSEKTYVSGFGHGRVEIVGQMAARLGLSNVLLGHHDPKRSDIQIDEMVALCQAHYREERAKLGTPASEDARIVGASDRMMIFIPSQERKRKGVVFGRMALDLGHETFEDAIGSQSSVVSAYKSFDLTQVYRLDDHTESL